MKIAVDAYDHFANPKLISLLYTVLMRANFSVNEVMFAYFTYLSGFVN